MLIERCWREDLINQSINQMYSDDSCHFLVNEIKEIIETIECISSVSIIYSFLDVIVTYLGGNGFRFYMIMQEMADHKYFYEQLLLTHHWDTKNCKTFANHFYWPISQVDFFRFRVEIFVTPTWKTITKMISWY